MCLTGLPLIKESPGFFFTINSSINTYVFSLSLLTTRSDKGNTLKFQNDSHRNEGKIFILLHLQGKGAALPSSRLLTASSGQLIPESPSAKQS